MNTFRSNRDIAVSVTDLASAERFYGGVLGFKLERKTSEQLVYDAGHFTLYISEDEKAHLPVPSFTVENLREAKAYLVEHGAEIVSERKSSLYFRDPFGIVYDIIEE